MFDYYEITPRADMERAMDRECGPPGKIGTHHLTCACTQLRLRDYVEALEAANDKLREALSAILRADRSLPCDSMYPLMVRAYDALAAGEGV